MVSIFRLGVKKSMDNHRFWSEIGYKFQGWSHPSPPKTLRSTPRDANKHCSNLVLNTLHAKTKKAESGSFQSIFTKCTKVCVLEAKLYLTLACRPMIDSYSFIHPQFLQNLLII